MDMAGDNIFFTAVDGTLFYDSGGIVESRHPAECCARTARVLADSASFRVGPRRDLDAGPPLLVRSLVEVAIDGLPPERYFRVTRADRTGRTGPTLGP